MNIRLNKVIRELNVGIDTIVDYLRENGFEVNATPNEKINDEQYDLLKKKFGADKDLRKEADKLFSGHQAGKAKNAKEKKAPAQKAQVIKTEIPENMRPGFKTVGQIDLDNKTVVKPQAQETPKKEAEAPKKEAAPAPAPKVETKPQPVKAEEKKPEPVKEHKPEAKKEEKPVQPKPVEKPAAKAEPEKKVKESVSAPKASAPQENKKDGAEQKPKNSQKKAEAVG